MPDIRVTDLTHEQWGRFWKASLEAIEPGSSKHCLGMNADREVSVHHHRLDTYIQRADWENVRIKFVSGGRTEYEGTIQMPSVLSNLQRLHRIFVAFNGMAPVSYDTGLMWAGKSMSVGDTVEIYGDTYRCDETCWVLI